MRTARLGRDETFAHGQRLQPGECEEAGCLGQVRRNQTWGEVRGE